MSNEISVSQDGKILRVTLNRGADGNGMTDDMVVELTRIIGDAPKTARIVRLEGAGSEFCIGRAGVKPPAPESQALDRRREFDTVFACYGAFRRSPIPIVGIVQGQALGLGCALAALCDITIASAEATFQVPEMGHHIMPGMVLSALIDRVPRKAITYLVHTTATIGAERALTFGLVSEVVPAAQLDAKVEEVCAAILRAPPIATEGVKEYVSRAMDMDTASAVDFARNLHAVLNSSREIKH